MSLRRPARYGAASVVTTVSLAVLSSLATGTPSGGRADVVGTDVGTVASFELNRWWVCGRSGERSPWSPVGPYCALPFGDLALRTLAVSMASGSAAAARWGVGARTLVDGMANLAAFASLWLVQFRISDRVPSMARRPSAADCARIWGT